MLAPCSVYMCQCMHYCSRLQLLHSIRGCSASCGTSKREVGRYPNGNGCVMFELQPKETMKQCEAACERKGFKFCSYQVDRTGDKGRCAGFFEQQEHGQVIAPGSCKILAAMKWQKSWDSFPTCSRPFPCSCPAVESCSSPGSFQQNHQPHSMYVSHPCSSIWALSDVSSHT